MKRYTEFALLGTLLWVVACGGNESSQVDTGGAANGDPLGDPVDTASTDPIDTGEHFGTGGGTDTGTGGGTDTETGSCDGSGDCWGTCWGCAWSGPCAGVQGQCEANAPCSALQSCLSPACDSQSGAAWQSCYDNCVAQHAAGETLLRNLWRCIYCNACVFDCATVEYDCSGDGTDTDTGVDTDTGAGPTRFKSLNFLHSIRGQQILSGQHNDQKNLDCGSSGETGPRYWTDRVHHITGKRPALWGGDFLFHGSASMRWEMTYEAEQQWNAGAIVNIMWHACPPSQGASCNWDGGLLSGLSESQFAELLTEGSHLNTIWKQRVDEIAVHLQYLKDLGVEVFWRPYHEQNQTAFWWNSQGHQNTAALWRMLHNYMTNDLGLNNLVWIWNVQDIGGSTDYWNWNPGDQYWDMLTLDIYADGLSNPHYYNNLLTAAGDKLVAIGECFNLPSSQYIDQYSEYTFFMTWAYGLKQWYPPGCQSTNSDDFIREVYDNPKVITLDEMPGWGRN